ncbi:MAG: hypothetical protein AAF430_15765 [Myxococcota bacterium]
MLGTDDAEALGWRVAGCALWAIAVAVRVWEAWQAPLLWGYDAWGHVSYVLFLDTFRALPWADQGWSYFHPPLHYVFSLPFVGSGDALTLARGMLGVSALASLGTAALAGGAVRLVFPGTRGLAALVSGCVACLPVHVIASGMVGNEALVTAFSAAAFVAFLSNEVRDAPQVWRTVGAGVLAGLALWTKYNGLLIVMAWLAAAVFLGRGGARRVLIAAGVAVVVASPLYLRNVSEFGTPIPTSRSVEAVAWVESGQAPGQRRVMDYLAVPAAVFTAPDPRSEALLGSVWGTAYAGVWGDVMAAAPAAVEAPPGWPSVLGLLPTLLAGVGVVLVWRDMRRTRQRAAIALATAYAAAVLGAFAVFAWTVPIWSALKASYLLQLSLPFGLGMARGLVALHRRGAGFSTLAVVALVLCFAATAARTLEAFGTGRPDSPALGAMHYALGDYGAARRAYRTLVESSGGSEDAAVWLNHWAATELADGAPARAAALYRRAGELDARRGRSDPDRDRALGVAWALAGEPERARATWGPPSTPGDFSNHGALAASEGEWAAAERALARALEASPELRAARHNRAVLQAARSERPEEGEIGVAVPSSTPLCGGPRGYPHGVGTGENLHWSVGRRALLILEPAGAGTPPGLGLARRSFYREARRHCVRDEPARTRGVRGVARTGEPEIARLPLEIPGGDA